MHLSVCSGPSSGGWRGSWRITLKGRKLGVERASPAQNAIRSFSPVDAFDEPDLCGAFVCLPLRRVYKVSPVLLELHLAFVRAKIVHLAFDLCLQEVSSGQLYPLSA